MKKFLKKITAVLCSAVMLFLIAVQLPMPKASALSTQEDVEITKNGQIVDSFQGIDAEYVTYSSYTGYYSCAGFVSRFYSKIFGVTVYNINTVDDMPSVYKSGHTVELKKVSTPAPGDIMQTKDYTHVAIVKEVSGSTVTLIEQNYKWTSSSTGKLLTRVNRRTTSTANYYYRLYIDGKMQSLDTSSPVISNAKASGLSNSGYTVSASLSDNYGVTTVKIGTYPKSKGSSVTKWQTFSNPGSSVTAQIKVSEFGSIDDTYITEIVAYDAAGNSSSQTVSAYIDTTPPKISNVKVTGVSASGYTVTCTISDTSTITAVKFPTWTTKNSTDDLDPNWETASASNGTISGTTATFVVKPSQHNYETGEYNTYVYAYDTYGNVSCKGVSVTILPAPTVKTQYDKGVDAVRIYWNKVNGADGYKIYRYDSDSGKWTVAGYVNNNTSLCYRDTNLKNGTAYQYRVQPYYKSGSTYNYGATSASIYTATNPTKTTITKYDKSRSGIRLYWNKINCTGYNIQQYDSTKKQWVTIKKITSSSTVNYFIGNLKSNTEYSYRIQAYTYDGNGGYTYGSFSDVKTIKTNS